MYMEYLPKWTIFWVNLISLLNIKIREGRSSDHNKIKLKINNKKMTKKFPPLKI